MITRTPEEWGESVVELCVGADRMRAVRLENLHIAQENIRDLREKIRKKWDSIMSLAECVDRTCAEDIHYFLDNETPLRCQVRDYLQDLEQQKETRDNLLRKLNGKAEQSSEGC